MPQFTVVSVAGLVATVYSPDEIGAMYTRNRPCDLVAFTDLFPMPHWKRLECVAGNGNPQWQPALDTLARAKRARYPAGDPFLSVTDALYEEFRKGLHYHITLLPFGQAPDEAQLYACGNMDWFPYDCADLRRDMGGGCVLMIRRIMGEGAGERHTVCSIMYHATEGGGTWLHHSDLYTQEMSTHRMSPEDGGTWKEIAPEEGVVYSTLDDMIPGVTQYGTWKGLTS
jgi:hypothetical protein